MLVPFTERASCERYYRMCPTMRILDRWTAPVAGTGCSIPVSRILPSANGSLGTIHKTTTKKIAREVIICRFGMFRVVKWVIYGLYNLVVAEKIAAQVTNDLNQLAVDLGHSISAGATP